MEADETQAGPPAPRTRQVIVSTLREACISTLQRYHQYLGDVGFIEPESLRSIAWHCSAEELARVEDETLDGSGRNLEWYTWHLWRRLLVSELGIGHGSQTPPLESPEPVDYTPPRGIDAQPGDYRQMYAERKAEVGQRAAAAKERIAAAYQQAQDLKDARKAKMIDKLVPAKRRCTSGVSRGHAPAASSAFLHKPRPDSRSSLMAKPGNQLKLLKDLGLVKAAAKPAASVRIIRPSPVPSAATGHSSSLAGAALLSKATGGQLGRTSVAAAGGPGGRPVEARPPHEAARAAAVAAARAATAGPSSSGGAAGGSSRPGMGFGSGLAGSKRHAGLGSASSPPQPAAKAPRSSGDPAGGSKSGGGQGPPKPDPRVMFPRQPPPGGSPLGQSKFAVPSARPTTLMQPAGAVGAVGRSLAAGAKGGRSDAGDSGLEALDDL